MFAHAKVPGKYPYLQTVGNRKKKGKAQKHVSATLGHMDHPKQKGRIEALIHSPARFSTKAAPYTFKQCLKLGSDI